MKKIIFLCMVVIGITSCKSDKQKVETLLSDLVEAQTNHAGTVPL